METGLNKKKQSVVDVLNVILLQNQEQLVTLNSYLKFNQSKVEKKYERFNILYSFVKVKSEKNLIILIFIIRLKVNY